ncbi:MAG TPA: ATPase domain-containing protein, partial [Acidobacteriaceae bacterium]|nr:ATPase domain-containing protein [Acidobacteriaceae bacterium]
MQTNSSSRPAHIDVRLKTGVTGLDDILGNGLPANHLYLLEGDPGTGKTTLAMQFLLEGVRRGEPALYVTLSESRRELEEVAESHGWSVQGLSIYEMTPVEDLLSPEAQYTVFHPSDVELTDTVSAILEQVEQIQPRRIVFDSLSEMRMLARDPLRYRRQILGLKRFFAGRECTVMLLDDHAIGDNDLQLQSIAHGVLVLQSTDRPYGINRRRLEVRKLRGSTYREGYHDFSIETGGLRVYPRLIAAEHRPGFSHAMLSSGITGLDTLLGGGVDRGTSTLLMGPAGCGKSTVAALYAYSAAGRGETAVMFCFDESPETLLSRCKAMGI